jgi:hypothetical protein
MKRNGRARQTNSSAPSGVDYSPSVISDDVEFSFPPMDVLFFYCDNLPKAHVYLWATHLSQIDLAFLTCSRYVRAAF